MFIHEIGSSDPRFRTVRLHEGMNIVLADVSENATSHDSRNGAGKSSLVGLMRYLLGGNVPENIKRCRELSRASYSLTIDTGDGQPFMVTRAISEPKRVSISGYTGSSRLLRGGGATSLDEWNEYVAMACFCLESADATPRLSQLRLNILRDYFETSTDVHRGENRSESTERLGYFMGFSPELLSSPREVRDLKQKSSEVTEALKTLSLDGLVSSESAVLAEIERTRQRAEGLEARLSAFRVDEQYSEHQDRADALTMRLRDLNISIAALRSRISGIERAMEEEREAVGGDGLADKLSRMYAEAGVVLPDAALRRYEEVRRFHESVIRNRRYHLGRELDECRRDLAELEDEVSVADSKRASEMAILEKTMALETFTEAQRELSDLRAQEEGLRRRLQMIRDLNSTKIQHAKAKARARETLNDEYREHADEVTQIASMFSSLCSELYRDRLGQLDIKITTEANLKITPSINGDSSSGIASAKTFLLDMCVLTNAMRIGRAPRMIVHDSRLFDSMDSRQLAGCLEIGDRLSREIGFQYVVMLNSDDLEKAEAESFSRGDLVASPVLDDSESGGLFGFRFG